MAVDLSEWPDPERWIAEGRSTADYPIPPDHKRLGDATERDRRIAKEMFAEWAEEQDKKHRLIRDMLGPNPISRKP